MELETVVISKNSLEEMIRKILLETISEIVNKPQNNKKMLKVKEAALYFGVPESTIRKWINNGKLKAEKYGKYLFIKIDKNNL